MPPSTFKLYSALQRIKLNKMVCAISGTLERPMAASELLQNCLIYPLENIGESNFSLDPTSPMKNSRSWSHMVKPKISS